MHDALRILVNMLGLSYSELASNLGIGTIPERIVGFLLGSYLLAVRHDFQAQTNLPLHMQGGECGDGVP